RYRQAIYAYGSRGFGKSHILLALACLLVRKGHKVVYIPDCGQMLRNPLAYLRKAVAFAFAASEPRIKPREILQCKEEELLENFCAPDDRSERLFFVIDQINALDHEPEGQDEVDNETKVRIRKRLLAMAAGNIEIRSASANDKTFKHMAARDTGD